MIQAMKSTVEWMQSVDRRISNIESVLNTILPADLDTEKSLMAEMVVRHGETMNKTDAAKLLGVTRATVYCMIRDGRILATKDGKRVMTRSVIDYMFGLNCPMRKKMRKKVKDDGADALEEAGQS